jgi:hypothetical protein
MERAAESVEHRCGCTGTKHVVRPGVSTAMSCDVALSSLTSDGDGRDLVLSARAQHALLGQLPCLQLSPIGGLETGQAEAGTLIAPTKSAVTMRAASVNRFILV